MATAAGDDENRFIPLEGADNFRDIGGYPTIGGRLVRRGLLFRSGHLGRLTNSDAALLASLGLKKVTDFRGPSEKADDPNRIIDGVRYVERPVDVAGPDIKAGFEALIRGRDDLVPRDYLTGVNHQFVRVYATVFGDWLQDLSRDEEAVPQVFHCTAGKDRTGFATALLLRILGVPVEIVLEDYLLTMRCIAGTIDAIIEKISQQSPIPGIGEKVRPLLGVDEAYLQAAFGAIESDWGDLESFIRGALKLEDRDVAALRARFLE